MGDQRGERFLRDDLGEDHVLTGVGEAGPEGGEVVLNVEESEVKGNVELGGLEPPTSSMPLKRSPR